MKRTSFKMREDDIREKLKRNFPASYIARLEKELQELKQAVVLRRDAPARDSEYVDVVTTNPGDEYIIVGGRTTSGMMLGNIPDVKVRFTSYGMAMVSGPNELAATFSHPWKRRVAPWRELRVWALTIYQDFQDMRASDFAELDIDHYLPDKPLRPNAGGLQGPESPLVHDLSTDHDKLAKLRNAPLEFDDAD